MSKTICRAKKTGEVKERGKASIEWRDDEGKPQYYCYGYKDSMTDELIEVCRNCKDNVIYAQEDLDKYIGEAVKVNDIKLAINHLTMLRRLDSGEKKKLYDVAISALEKQTPKRVLNIKSIIFKGANNENFKSGECPRCGEYVNSDDDSFYCGSKGCGQAILWEDKP